MSATCTATRGIACSGRKAAILVDECVDKFYALTRGLTPHEAMKPRVGGRPPADVPPVKAFEYWVEVETPPVCGKIDRVAEGKLTDFKSGEAHADAHSGQLLFYAMLWLLRFNLVPTALELRYAAEVVEVRVPDRTALGKAAGALATEIGQAVRIIPLGPPVAKPSEDNCRYCPVRQLCGEYWHSPATASLRSASPNGSEPRDVRVTRLPAGWKGGVSCRGLAEAEGLGKIELDVPDSHCPAGRPLPVALRLLGAFVGVGETAATVRATAFTEAFWE